MKRKMTNLAIMILGNKINKIIFIKKTYNTMGCGCKNKSNGAASNGAVKVNPSTNQESTPVKPLTNNKIIKREIQ